MFAIGDDIDTPQTFVDIQGFVKIAINDIKWDPTKHIDVQYHLAGEALRENSFNWKFCVTPDLFADILTKPLEKSRFTKVRQKMALSHFLDYQKASAENAHGYAAVIGV